MSGHRILMTALPFGIGLILAVGFEIFRRYKSHNKISFKYCPKECLVCLQKLTSEEKVVFPCQHHFCQSCTTMILENQSTCPQCRTRLPRSFETQIRSSLDMETLDLGPNLASHE